MPDNHLSKEKTDSNRALVCTCGRLRRTAQQVTRLYNAALRPVGLTLMQFSILATVSRSDGLSVTQLAQLLGLERTTLTRNLRPLELAGWIAVGVGTDKRSRKLSLTVDGIGKLQQARPLWRSAEEDLRCTVGPDKVKDLVRLLDLVFGETSRVNS